MPKLCDTHVTGPLNDHTYLKYLAKPAGKACNTLSEKLGFLEIWGEEDKPEVIDWTDWRVYWNYIKEFYDVNSPWYLLACHLTILFFGLFFGYALRWNENKSVREAQARTILRERQLSQQLWDIMMEKSAVSKQLKEAVEEKNTSQAQLNIAQQEIEAVKMKNMTLERICAITKADKDKIEEKVADFMKGHNSYMDNISKTNKPSNKELLKLEKQVTGLQNLVTDVLKAYKSDYQPMANALANGSGV